MIGLAKIGSDDDLVRLNDAAWRVLERSGFKVYSHRLFDSVEALGARVDRSAMVARFPRGLLDETLGCELRPEPPEEVVRVPDRYCAGFGEVCFVLFDWETGE